MQNVKKYCVDLTCIAALDKKMEKLRSSNRVVDISEPILAEDSTFSMQALSLIAILEQLNENATHHDYLVALLFVLLAESGFSISSSSNTLKR